MTTTRLTFLVLFLTATAFSSVSVAQVVGADDYEAPEGRPGSAISAPTTTDTPSAAFGAEAEEPAPTLMRQPAAGNWTVNVQVRHANDESAELANLPVFLHAVRPRGPFESGPVQPQATWTSTTNAAGVAQFSGLPDDLAMRGLRLQASTTYGGISFDSAASGAADGVEVGLTVYDRGHDLSGLRLTQKRVVVEPWEEYIIVSQFWTMVLEADHAVDIALSPDPALQRGLPLRLPIQAEGIHFSGPGQHEIINSVVFWNGVLQPNQPVSFQVRFSQSARSSSFTYEQTMEFPVDEVQIIAPVQTQYQKMPRLDELALLAPGFDVGVDADKLGLRADMEFLVATGRSLQAGESYTFRLEGLPFRRPTGGWFALFGGLLVALLVIGYGRREARNMDSDRSRERLLATLQTEREQLLDEIAQIHRERKEIDPESDYALTLEDEEALLRERLALILRKIRDLEGAAAPA